MAVIPLDQSGNQTGADSLIKDGSMATFMQDVVQASLQQPVLVDFWATWCAPCKQLMPVLEKVVREKAGKVKLVKLDIDKNKPLATQLQIQSVPAVYAFVGGQPVDAFMGVLPEAQLRQFIDRLLSEEPGDAAGDALTQAKEELQSGNVAGAAILYQQILSEQPDHVAALTGLAQCYLKSNDAARAEQVAAKIPEKDRGQSDVASLFAALDLLKSAPSSPVSELRDKVKQDPKNQELRLDLANAYAASQQIDEAVDVLLESISLDRKWNDEAARKQLLKLFDLLGFDDPRAISGRKRLSSILFR